jgi:hypothetical protein
MEKKSTKISFAIVLITIMLLCYALFDAFYLKPSVNKKIEKVTIEFLDFKTYLDTKLPQIDSALIIHSEEIQCQNKKLEELNTLTKRIADQK